jgi:hypothetical protein
VYSIFDPARFQGRGKSSRYFEGWYYKLVTADQSAAIAIIPGIAMGDAGKDSHAFIQVFDGAAERYNYWSTSLDNFCAAKKQLDVTIGSSRFRTDSMEPCIDTPDFYLKGSLRFSSIAPWPISLLSPGAMGWYRYVPFMEDYHGILSFNHSIEGALTLNGREIDFTRGKGYIEKDWGKGFPQAWIWMQSNHFEHPQASLTFSVAIIPWLGNFFSGFICGIWLDGKLFKFCTYTGAKIRRLQVGTGGTLAIAIQGERHTLELAAHKHGGIDLKAPALGSMSGRANESLRSEIHAVLHCTRGRNKGKVFEGTGRCAGVEINGDIAKLRKGLKLP